MKIEQIKKYIISKPSKIQIAKDDKWEDVWIIDATKQLPSSNELQEYLESSQFQHISIEILFEQSDGVYIFGMDYNEHLLTKTPYNFLMQSIDITKMYTDFSSFLQVLGSKLIGKRSLFAGEFDVIRIGIINHWFSIGLCVIWQKDWLKNIQLGELRKKIETNQKLYRTNLNSQGMSFVINLKGISPGICHWIKSPCSNKEGKYWVLSEQKIIQYLKDWADIHVT